MVLRFSSAGDIVLDPFCGSGSVLHEALISSRSVVGWDSSPLAVLLASAKVGGIYTAEEKELLNIRSELQYYTQRDSLFPTISIPDYPVPPMPRVRDIQSWFGENAMRELAFLRYFVFQAPEKRLPWTNLLIKIAFSRIIVSASNQQSESSYRRVKKSDEPFRVIKLFDSAIGSIISNAKRCQKLLEVNGITRMPRKLKITEHENFLEWGDISAQIAHRDGRKDIAVGVPRGKKPILVVTSPPYLMSWDYGLYHKFRFYWLGFDLDAYEETEIGRHLRRKNDDVERYCSDMVAIFKTLTKVMDQKAHLAFVNSPSVVYGKIVDTNELLTTCAKLAGWKLLSSSATIGIPGPHHGMYASLEKRGATAPGESGKQEHVLIFKRR